MATMRMGGVGISFQQDPVNPKILQVYKLKAGGPADTNGRIEIGDRLSEIDGVDVIQQSAFNQPSIPGEDGTYIDLTFDKLIPGPVKRYLRYTVRLIREAAFHPDKLVAPGREHSQNSINEAQSKSEWNQINWANERALPPSNQDSNEHDAWQQEKQFLLKKIQKLEESKSELKATFKSLQERQARRLESSESNFDEEQMRKIITELEQDVNENSKQCLKLAKEVVRLRMESHRSRINSPTKDAADLARDIALEKSRIASLNRQLSMLETP